MYHQYLAVGSTAGTDTNHGYPHGTGYFIGQSTWNALEQQHAGTSGLQRQGVIDQGACLCFFPTLDLVTADHVHRLRCQPEMHTNGYAVAYQCGYRRRQPARTLYLDHVRAGLHQLCAAVDRLFQRGVTHERKIRHDEGANVAAPNRAGVVGHVFNRYRQSAVMALQHHSQ